MWFSHRNLPATLSDLAPGQRICLLRDVDRAEFVAPAGRTGAIEEIHQFQTGYLVSAIMDLPLQEDVHKQAFIRLKWGNAIEWYIPHVDPQEALAAFLLACELQESDWPIVGRRCRFRREIDRLSYLSVASIGRTGFVSLVNELDESISMTLDVPLFADERQQAFEAAHGGNILQWVRQTEPLDSLAEFLADCELLDDFQH
jgi:hypothetical protein